MKYNTNNKPIALFGVGFRGERFYYANHEKENIEMCFDNCSFGTDHHSNRHVGTEFHGIPVQSPEAQTVRKYFIIITIEDYRPIRDQLEGYGLIEFEDFIGWKFYGKKVALLHGNCYIHVWAPALTSSKAFQREYVLYDHPALFMNPEKRVRESALHHCDLLISQDVQADNMYGYLVSLEYITGQVPETCQVIVVPNLVGLGKGFFPQAKPEAANSVKRDVFPQSDTNIDRMVLGGQNRIRSKKN